MADNSESTGSVPYEPTPPAFLISAREWAKYEIKVVREDGVVVDTIGTRLPMNCYLLCLCGIARRGYRPEMRITEPRLRMMRIFLRCGGGQCSILPGPPRFPARSDEMPPGATERTQTGKGPGKDTLTV